MRVPDPEDPKYATEVWREYLFDLPRYVEDFRKWKAELRRKLEFHKKYDNLGSQIYTKLLKEILGEEASEWR